MTPLVRYPSGPVTPHGAFHVLRNRIPQVALRSYDDTVVFNLMGGLAIADVVMNPERVELKELSGLVPPWTMVDQKGATQDGTSFIDALYDPIEVVMRVRAKGRDPHHLRQVLRDLIASIDVKQTSELSWFTQDLGRWWAPVRWFKTIDDKVSAVPADSQELSLRLRADSGFWQSYDNVEQFRFSYSSAVDDFNFVDTDDLGSNWTIATTDSGTTQVARRNSFTTTTDNQVVELRIGKLAEWFFGFGAGNDIWARMNTTGTPGTSGIRVRFGGEWIRLSYFVGGVEHVLRERPLFIPPVTGETFTLVAGYDGSTLFGSTSNPRMFKVLRNGIAIMSVKEIGTDSPMGSSNRGAGFGMHGSEAGHMSADGAQVKWVEDTPGTSPAGVQLWSVGDNTHFAQEGFIRRINVGDQPFWDRYTCFGPGIFRFANGPGSSDMVEFGPLLNNQVMQIRTDPRKRGVVDLTSTAASPQEHNTFLQAIEDFISFATGNNVPPLLQAIESLFGIQPPQGNPYSLMHGRFSNPIPPKSPGQPAQPVYIKVSIDEGNADSKIIASGTPLRRYPY